MRKILIVLAICVINSSAYTTDQIYYAINSVAKEYKISPKILYTIVKIESNFRPFAISFLTNKENAEYFKSLESRQVKITISNYSLNRSKWVVAIHPSNEKAAKQIAKLLVEDGFSVDVGLGQINSINFTVAEIDKIFDPKYNLKKGAKVLRDCFDAKNGDLEYTIECYNYGMRNRSSNPYYRRFYEHYIKKFSN